MNSFDTHIIRRQIVDIDYVGSTDDGVALQQQMVSLCTDTLIPGIEKVFMRYANIQGHFYLDRLEIDLGKFQRDELEGKLAAIFREKLAFALAEYSIDQSITLGDEQPVEVSAPIRYIDDVTAFTEALVYFLFTGHLPWNYKLPENQSLNSILQIQCSQPNKEVILARLREAIYQAVARRRFVLQFDAPVIRALLEWISPGLMEEARKLLTVFTEKEFLDFYMAIEEAALKVAVSGQVAGRASEVFNEAISLAEENTHSWKAFPRDRIVAIALDQHIISEPVFSEKLHVKDDNYTQPGSSAFPQMDEKPAWYVENAGLVLLHPFLPRLFEGTGLIKNNNVIDPDRALLLLHYLSTGQNQAPEYELTLSKIICGIPFEEPVSAHAELRPTDIEEADALLNAVIQHWSALRNTSPDNLRGSFLIRPGKVSTTYEGHWLLQVERRSYDILLDNIPWGFGIIKLPWLEKSIHVEW